MPQPERMCIACRAKGSPREFLRIVATPDNTIIWDLKQKLPGRGAHVCPQTMCVSKGLEKKKLMHALRVEELSPFSVQEKLTELQILLRNQALNSLKIGVKARKVLSGYTQVQQGMKKGLAKVLVLADDISLDRRNELSADAARLQIPCVFLLSQEEMGSLFATAQRSCLVITDTGLASTFIHNFERYRTMKKEGM